MTKRQFAPRIEEQRAGTQARLAFAGSRAGTVRNTAPLPIAERTAVRVPTSTTLSAETFWVEDHFTMTAGSLGPFTLSYLPIDNSPDITVNGVTLLPSTDWTITGAVVTILSGVSLGIAADTWDLLVQYEVLSSAAALVPAATPTLVSVTPSVVGVGTITLPNAPTATNFAILATPSGSPTPTGAFATWTHIRNVSTGGSDLRVDLWTGVGVGTGSVISGATRMVCAVYDGVSAVAIADLQSTVYPAFGGAFTGTASAPAATSVTGDIVLGALAVTGGGSAAFYPTGVYTQTGFDALVASSDVTQTSVGGGGTAVTAGLATGTSADASFGVFSSGPNGWGEVINVAFTWTPA